MPRQASRGRQAEMRRALLAWYDGERRELPWRGVGDAYAIWVSEIMLQQTRVAAVLEHYRRFLAKYPTVLSLSLAPVEDVLAAWSGLGYYRRARMLHEAAKTIVLKHGGSLPGTLEEIRELPGIGHYTSAAIGSIAFGLPVAAVDGNVERVLARVEAKANPRGGAQWRVLAQKLLDVSRPGDFNQAMMDLGAQVCTPRRPSCVVCPLYRWCRTRGEHPVPPRQQMRSVQTAVALLVRETDGATKEVLLEQRGGKEPLMPGMWELPPVGLEPGNAAAMAVRHAITTTNYYVHVYLFGSESELPAIPHARRWVGEAELPGLALTGLARKVLRRAGLLTTH